MIVAKYGKTLWKVYDGSVAQANVRIPAGCGLGAKSGAHGQVRGEARRAASSYQDVQHGRPDRR